MKKIIAFLALSLLSWHAYSQTALEKKLFEMPDIIFKALPVPDEFEQAFELLVKQPLDHHHPEKGSYYQRVWFSHRGYDRPTVIVTEGYYAKDNRIYELTNLLHANQLRVEHRYFEPSAPEKPYDWQYLNMEQACADLHRVRQLFSDLYQGKWVSTGISKGGMTSIYYRYFYPEDVDVSVPYVAPIDTAYEDARIYHFFDTIGTPECRAKIKALQLRLLKDREEASLRLKWHSAGANTTFDYLGFEQAFEYAVLEYPFGFWQLGGSCAAIPDEKAPIDTIVRHFIAVSGMSLFSDQELKNYGPHYYQAGTETGYYGYEKEDFKKYLHYLPEKPSAIFMPDKIKPVYDPALSKKVFRWTQEQGHKMIYIYGGTDTWTSAGVPPSNKVDADWFIMANRHHGDARIKNMSAEERSRLIGDLERWLGMEIE
jgi:hypothetical protein